MIKVTRLNHTELVINADLIEFMECTPDTILTMITGRKVVVSESVDEVIRRVIAYRHETGIAIPRLEGANAATEETQS